MDDPGGATDLIPKIILLLVLILVNAFFSMSELAIISLNDNKIKKLAEAGNKKALKIQKLTADSSKFLSTIQIGVTLAGFLTSAAAADNFASLLAGWLEKTFSLTSGLSAIRFISLFVITIIISYFSLVLGELVPKRIAMQKSQPIAFAVAGPLSVIKAGLRPFIWLLSVSCNFVVRLFGLDPNADEEQVTEEEIRLLVDVGEEKGVIEESQKEMINNIFEFDDISAQDVMTHRTDIFGVEIKQPVEDVLEIAIKEGYSRIPVYEDELDNIIGVIYIKDLLRFVGSDIPHGFELSELIREAYFVPESKRCGALFTEMTEKHLHLCVVVDEYGGTAGIVTIEDLIESIVGSIQDEYDNETDEIQQLDESTYAMDGAILTEDVEDRLKIKLPDGDYDTLGGLILSLLGRIPETGENPSFEISGYRFTVNNVTDRRIERVTAEKLPQIDKSGKAVK